MELLIACLVGHEFVKAGDFIQRWLRTTVIRWNAWPRVPNQEREMELLQKFRWEYGRIVELWMGFGWVWSSFGVDWFDSIGSPVNPISTDSLFDPSQRWSDWGWLAFWWEEVIGNVFNEDTFALNFGKYWYSLNSPGLSAQNEMLEARKIQWGLDHFIRRYWGRHGKKSGPKGYRSPKSGGEIKTKGRNLQMTSEEAIIP